jgi:hypothetical protein
MDYDQETSNAPIDTATLFSDLMAETEASLQDGTAEPVPPTVIDGMENPALKKYYPPPFDLSKVVKIDKPEINIEPKTVLPFEKPKRRSRKMTSEQKKAKKAQILAGIESTVEQAEIEQEAKPKQEFVSVKSPAPIARRRKRASYAKAGRSGDKITLKVDGFTEAEIMTIELAAKIYGATEDEFCKTSIMVQANSIIKKNFNG